MTYVHTLCLSCTHNASVLSTRRCDGTEVSLTEERLHIKYFTKVREDLIEPQNKEIECFFKAKRRKLRESKLALSQIMIFLKQKKHRLKY